MNHVWQVGRRPHLDPGRHSLKFGVDVRREAMKIAFINRPNGDLTFSGGITGNAAADFLLGLPAQARATTTAGDPGRLRLAVRRLRRRTSSASPRS